MATRSVIDIDINDEKFQSFLKAFTDYKSQAEDTPKDWEALSAAIGGSASSLDKLTKKQKEALGAIGHSMSTTGHEIEKAASSQNRFTAALHRSGHQARKLAHDVKRLGGAMKDLAGLGLGFAGAAAALGGAALFGLGDMADTVNKKRIAAMQLGVGIGQRKGFSTAYTGVFGGEAAADSYLEKIRQEEFTSPQYLMSIGANPNAKNVLHPAEQVLMAAHDYYRQARDQGVNRFAAAGRVRALMGNVLSDEQIAEVGHLSASSLKAMATEARKNAAAMRINAARAAKWTAFTTQLQTSLGSAENTLLNALGNKQFLGALDSALRGATHAFVRMVENPAMQDALEHLGSWIASTTKYLESSRFHKKLAGFVSDVELVGSEILSVAKALSWLVPKHQATGEHGNKGFANPKDNPYNWNDHSKVLFGLLPGDRYMGPDYYKTNPDNPANQARAKAHAMGLYTNPANWRKYNNPGDIDPHVTDHGVTTNAYQKYRTMADGYRAMERVIRGYHQDTIAGIMHHYDPTNPAQANEVAQISHMGINQKLDLNNPHTMAKLEAAIARTEQPHKQDQQQLYETIYNAIRDGMRASATKATIPPGARVATSIHAASAQ